MLRKDLDVGNLFISKSLKSYNHLPIKDLELMRQGESTVSRMQQGFSTPLGPFLSRKTIACHG